MTFPPHTVFDTMHLPKAKNNKNPNRTELNEVLRLKGAISKETLFGGSYIRG